MPHLFSVGYHLAHFSVEMSESFFAYNKVEEIQNTIMPLGRPSLRQSSVVHPEILKVLYHLS